MALVEERETARSRVGALGVPAEGLGVWRKTGASAPINRDEAIVDTTTSRLEGGPIRKVRQSSRA